MHEPSASADQNTANEASRADDLEQLRERLAFYESFDKLIQDNISRAGDLLREVASRKSEGEIALRSTVAEYEQKQLAERVTYRRIFSSLLDEVTTVQQNVERLARQVADALDDLEAVIPAAGETAAIEDDKFPSMPTFSAGSAGELAPGFHARQAAPEQAAAEPEHVEPPHAMEPVDELVTPDEAQYDPTLMPETGSLVGSMGTGVSFTGAATDNAQHEVADVTTDLGDGEQHDGELSVDLQPSEQAWQEPAHYEPPAAAPVEDQAVEQRWQEPAHVDRPPQAHAEDQPLETQAEPAVDDWVDDSPSATTTLLIHGVPRATTALSLKRYLEGLDQVHSVEPREYAEGVLRLQVSSDRPVGLDDLRGWPEAAGLSPVSVSEEFVEVRLGD